ncbi:MAG: hypothetical protein NUV61_02895 [Candidatus Azambacteria bacterium]|nr:hypothetical protein [Candidatus Azambacteria bacterium]
MTKEQLKNAVISVLLGALTIFLASLLQGLLNIVNDLLVQGIGGAVTTGSYLIKTYRV